MVFGVFLRLAWSLMWTGLGHVRPERGVPRSWLLPARYSLNKADLRSGAPWRVNFRTRGHCNQAGVLHTSFPTPHLTLTLTPPKQVGVPGTSKGLSDPARSAYDEI